MEGVKGRTLLLFPRELGGGGYSTDFDSALVIFSDTPSDIGQFPLSRHSRPSRHNHRVPRRTSEAV